MANINVSYQELNSAADRLIAGRDDLNSKIGERQSLIGQLVSSGFVTDKSSGAFNTSYDQFSNGARQTISGIDGLSNFLRITATTLSEVDAQLAARLNR